MLLRALLATLVVAASLIPGLPQSSQPAQAFKVWVHEEILAAALDPGTMSDLAMGLILLGNATADIHQFADEMHFDNARSPREICDRWEAGLNAFMTEAVELSEPDSPGGQFLKDREGALQAYGRVTHAIADFYAHTNWIDTIAEYVPGMYPPTAPILSSVCDPDAFPPTLLSGFFDLRFGIDACPELGGEPAPPPGFLYCHEQLAKDERDAGHGAEIVPGMRVTYHEIAVSLSTDSTRASWSVLRDRVRARWGRNPEIDADCVFKKLAFGDLEPCRRVGPGLDGYVYDAANGAPIAGATVTIGDQSRTTDLGGHYGFLGLSGGSTRVTASASDYQTQGVDVNVPVNGYAVAPDIRLSPRMQFGQVAGIVRNAANGQAISGATVTAGGRSATVDSSGRFRLTEVPVGRVEVTASANGFISDTQSAAVTTNASVDLTFALSQRVAQGQTRVVLSWGATPKDLDAHLWVPSGTSASEISFSSKGNATAAPFAALDVDDRDGTGPETITIARNSPGTYTYAVYNYSNDAALGTSGARVQIVRGDGVAQTFNVPSGSGRWWTVFTMDGATGAITPVNRLGDTAPR